MNLKRERWEIERLFQTDERRRCTKAQFKRNKEHFEQEIMQSYPRVALHTPESKNKGMELKMRTTGPL